MTVPPAILMTVPLAVPLTVPMTATLDRPLTAVLSQYPYRTTRAPDSTSAPCSGDVRGRCGLVFRSLCSSTARRRSSQMCTPKTSSMPTGRRGCGRERDAAAVAALQRCNANALRSRCATLHRCGGRSRVYAPTRALPCTLRLTLHAAVLTRAAVRSKRVTATPDALGARGYSREGSAQSTREYSHGARCTRRVGYVLASAYVSTAARPRLPGWQVQFGSKTLDPSLLWDPAGTEHAGTGRRPSPTASAEAPPADRRLATTTTASMQHTKPARATLPNEAPGFRRPAVSQEAGLGVQVVAVAVAVL